MTTALWVLFWAAASLPIATLVLLVMFIGVIALKRLVERYPWMKGFVVIHFGLGVFIAVAFDIFFNYTWAYFIFKAKPVKPKKSIWKDARAYTLTRRLQQYKYGPGGWRRNRALWWCDIIEFIDPGHCTK